MELRVALAVGDNHTRHCGVKDYANTLAAALRDEGVQAEVLAPNGWGYAGVKAFRHQLRAQQYDVVHVQYPSIGNRYSLLPHLLPALRAARASVVTLHEHSALPVSQSLSTQVFRWTADAVILSSEYERDSFDRLLKRSGAPQQVIPIGSNIPGSAGTSTPSPTVVYFGQIRPNKGLEAFLELAKISIHAGKQWEFCVLGSITAANREYAEHLQQEAANGVLWSVDSSFAEVGSILCNSFTAYLPFPDGASERRGSMLAAVSNGLPVISTFGPATTPTLRQVLLQAANPQAALETLDRLRADPEEREHLRCAATSYAMRHEWGTIARQHVALYRDLLLQSRSSFSPVRHGTTRSTGLPR